MFINWRTLDAILHKGSETNVALTSGLVMFSYESKYDPIEWLAGFVIFSLRPVLRFDAGVKAKLKPLFAKVAAWHFNLLSLIGNPFRAFIAF